MSRSLQTRYSHTKAHANPFHLSLETFRKKRMMLKSTYPSSFISSDNIANIGGRRAASSSANRISHRRVKALSNERKSHSHIPAKNPYRTPITTTLPALASPLMDKMMAEQQKVDNTMRFPTPMKRTAKPEANRDKRPAKFRITS